MSRLDYVTIAIVAVCVAALIYLIYMTTNLLGGPEEPPLTETTPAETESYEEDTYPFDSQEDTIGAEEDAYPADDYSDYDYDNGQDLDKGRSSTATTGQSSANQPATTYDEPAASTTTTARGGSSYGNYLVLAGTFSVKANAESMVQKLRDMGYSNASVEPFDRGAYSVALVNRFDSFDAANGLVQELKNKGVESYVKKAN